VHIGELVGEGVIDGVLDLEGGIYVLVGVAVGVGVCDFEGSAAGVDDALMHTVV
jgi:hypothetical protein